MILLKFENWSLVDTNKMHETSGKHKLNYFLSDKHPGLSDSIEHLESVQLESKILRIIFRDMFRLLRSIAFNILYCVKFTLWTIEHGLKMFLSPYSLWYRPYSMNGLKEF